MIKQADTAPMPAAPPTVSRRPAGLGEDGSAPKFGLAWPFFLGLLLLYVPTVAQAGQAWFANDNYSHGIFVFPIAAALLWFQKDRFRQAGRKPEAIGLPLLIFGLLLKLGSDLFQFKYIAMWSLVPSLAGGILLIYGQEVWRIARFSVFFLLFAAPIPNAVLYPMTVWIQGVSTSGAATVMSFLGFPLLKSGNLIQLPGLTLEVADVCSGFHKLISLLTFSVIYSYLYSISVSRKLILVASTLPVAIFSNVLRICAMVAAGSLGGITAVHAAHDPAELVAIGIAFALFVTIGRMLGCGTNHFWLRPDA